MAFVLSLYLCFLELGSVDALDANDFTVETISNSAVYSGMFYEQISGGNDKINLVVEHGFGTIDVVTKTFLRVMGTTSTGNADGTLPTARTKNARHMSLDTSLFPAQKIIYYADNFNHKIRKIDVAANEVTTFAGSSSGSNDGHGTHAKFNHPREVIVVGAGSSKKIYVVDERNHLLRIIDASTLHVTRHSGSGSGARDGPATVAKYNIPAGAYYSSSSSTIYIADRGNNRIRAVNINTDIVSTLSGTAGSSGRAGRAKVDGSLLTARFSEPYSMGGYLDRYLVVGEIDSEGGNSGLEGVRFMDLTTQTVTSLMGTNVSPTLHADGLAANSIIRLPLGIMINPISTYIEIYVADTNGPLLVLKSTALLDPSLGGDNVFQVPQFCLPHPTRYPEVCP